MHENIILNSVEYFSELKCQCYGSFFSLPSHQYQRSGLQSKLFEHARSAAKHVNSLRTDLASPRHQERLRRGSVLVSINVHISQICRHRARRRYRFRASRNDVHGAIISRRRQVYGFRRLRYTAAADMTANEMYRCKSISESVTNNSWTTLGRRLKAIDGCGTRAETRAETRRSTSNRRDDRPINAVN